MESDVDCMQQQVMGDPHVGEQSVYIQQQSPGQNTTALKVPGRSFSRVLVEPNPV